MNDTATHFYPVSILQKKLATFRTTVTELQNQDIQPPPDISQLEDDVKQQEERFQKACREVSGMIGSFIIVQYKATLHF